MTDDIILKFTNADLLIDDSAYKKIVEQEHSNQIVDSLIKDLSGSNDNFIFLTEPIVDQYIQKYLSKYDPQNYSNQDSDIIEDDV